MKKLILVFVLTYPFLSFCQDTPPDNYSTRVASIIINCLDGSDVKIKNSISLDEMVTSYVFLVAESYTEQSFKSKMANCLSQLESVYAHKDWEVSDSNSISRMYYIGKTDYMFIGYNKLTHYVFLRVIYK
ncbi:MAG: hypothetical protein AB9834_01230 [Lentimicrobium sp.]